MRNKSCEKDEIVCINKKDYLKDDFFKKMLKMFSGSVGEEFKKYEDDYIFYFEGYKMDYVKSCLIKSFLLKNNKLRDYIWEKYDLCTNIFNENEINLIEGNEKVYNWYTVQKDIELCEFMEVYNMPIEGNNCVMESGYIGLPHEIKDENEINVQLSASPVFDDEKNLICIMTIFTDLTPFCKDNKLPIKRSENL